jgi:mannose/fructose/N-acetylgalactosamine-specific phosphotransferase system component IIC
MDSFLFYITEGWNHIISADALDHQLFIIALVALYTVKEIKQLLILVTAFTIGHSITLALSTYNIISVNSAWVEFLIPCTIIITGILNIIQLKQENSPMYYRYGITLFFGLIHGLGFANTIKMMLAKTQSFGWSLFGFNLGLEIGQIIVVSLFILLNFLIVKKIGLSQKYWVIMFSLIAIVLATYFAFERLPF